VRLFKYLFVLICIILSNHQSNGQDTIRTQKDTIRCKVIEIGIDEIKYKDFDNLNGPVIVIDKRGVIEITYENGKKTKLWPDEYELNPEVEVRYKKHAVKFEFFSPLTNDIAFGYETMIKVGMNLEFKAAIIGPGFTKMDEDASGFFLKAGVKFLTHPTYYQRGVKYAHGLKGFYFKPELIFSSYTATREIYDYTYNYNYNYNYGYYNTQVEIAKVHYYNYAMNIILGKQHVFGNSFTLDYYFGLGYGFQVRSRDGSEDNDLEDDYCYSHLWGGKDSPMVYTAGLTIGYLF
jgi:hypothetical protein